MTVEAADVSSRTFFNYSATKDEALIGDPITDGPDFQDALLAQPSDRSVVKAIRRALAPTIDDIQNHRELWRLRMRVTKANPWLLPALFVCGAAVEFVAAIAKRTGHPADSAFTELTATSVEATVAEDAVAPAGAPLAAEAVDASVSAIATEAAAEAGAAEPSAAGIVEASAGAIAAEPTEAAPETSAATAAGRPAEGAAEASATSKRSEIAGAATVRAESETPGAAHGVPGRGRRRRGRMSRAEVVRALSGLMLGMFVAILASTIVSNALPRIVADLGGSQSVYTWIVTTELLSMTATVPLWGKPADLYSKKVADPGLALAARGRVADCRIHAQCGRSDPQTDRAGRRRAAAEEPAPAVECPEVKLGTGLITAGVSTLLIWSTLAGRHRRRRPSRW